MYGNDGAVLTIHYTLYAPDVLLDTVLLLKPVAVEPCKEFSAVPVLVAGLPVTIRPDHLGFVCICYLIQLRQGHLLCIHTCGVYYEKSELEFKA